MPVHAQRFAYEHRSIGKPVDLADARELGRSQVSPCDLALVNIGLGRKEEAIAWLQKASLKPDDFWLSLQVDSRFDPLRSNPRFQALLRQMKLLS